MRKEGYQVPQVEFMLRENGQWVTRTTADFFDGKRVAFFSLPGAFTPTCSSQQLPGFEQYYDEIVQLGIDEIYCISVNDVFVMDAWRKAQGIEKVKFIPDGNAYFTRSMGYLVNKSNLGFGERSWRYSAIVNAGIIEKIFVEEGMKDNSNIDPHMETLPQTMIDYLKTVA